MRWLTSLDTWLMFLASLALALTALILGRLIGGRVRVRDPEGADHMPAVQNALLGLLSLMIGFTLPLAMSRFQARQAAVLKEASAIDSAWARASLLPATEAAAAHALLERYLATRIALGEPGARPGERAELIAHSHQILDVLWAEARDAVAQDNRALPASLFVPALDGLSDADQERLAADRSGVPQSVFGALDGLAAVAFGYLGFVSGAKGARNIRSIVLLAAAFMLVITILSDFDRPQAGLVVVSQRPLQDVAENLRS